MIEQIKLRWFEDTFWRHIRNSAVSLIQLTLNHSPHFGYSSVMRLRIDALHHRRCQIMSHFSVILVTWGCHMPQASLLSTNKTQFWDFWTHILIKEILFCCWVHSNPTWNLPTWNETTQRDNSTEKERKSRSYRHYLNLQVWPPLF